MSRYDSQVHLDDWSRGVLPGIYQPLAEIIDLDGENVLDLCCGTGILGAWCAREGAASVIGVDGNQRSLEAGRKAGITHELRYLKLVRPWGALRDVLIDRGITVVLARRCIPEILGEHLPGWDDMFSELLANAGVRTIYLEGRKASANAKNRLYSLDEEILALGRNFRVEVRRGAVAELTTCHTAVMNSGPA